MSGGGNECFLSIPNFQARAQFSCTRGMRFRKAACDSAHRAEVAVSPLSTRCDSECDSDAVRRTTQLKKAHASNVMIRMIQESQRNVFRGAVSRRQILALRFACVTWSCCLK